MLSKNYKKRGFTIVELVIVIAVIAILSAILIPTFVNLIDKAKRSADQRAIANLNEVVAVESSLENIDSYFVKEEDASYAILDVNNVYKLIEEHSLVPNYQPLSKGMKSCYDNFNNSFLLYDESTKKVVFPAKYKNLTISSILESFDATNPTRGYYFLSSAEEPDGDDSEMDGEFKFEPQKSHTDNPNNKGYLTQKGQPYTGLNKSNVGITGLYYENGYLCNGEITSSNGTGKTYKYENGVLVLKHFDNVTNSSTGYTVNLDTLMSQNIDTLDQEQYATKEVIVKLTPGDNWYEGYNSTSFITNASGVNRVIIKPQSNYTVKASIAKSEMLDNIAKLEELVNKFSAVIGEDNIDETLKQEQEKAYEDAVSFIKTFLNGDSISFLTLPNLTQGYFDKYLTWLSSQEDNTVEIGSTYNDTNYEIYLNNYAFNRKKNFAYYLLNINEDLWKESSRPTSLISDGPELTTMGWHLFVTGTLSGKGLTEGDLVYWTKKQTEFEDTNYYCKTVEPELVLLGWKLLYEKAYFAGFIKGGNITFLNDFNKQSSEINGSNAFENGFLSSEWLEKVQKYDKYVGDNLQLYYLNDFIEGQTFELEKYTSGNPSQFVMGLLGGFTTNLYNGSYIEYGYDINLTFTNNNWK